MADILIKWLQGDGNIVISENGGDVLISSDTANNGVEREQTLTFRTTTGNATASLIVRQKGNRIILRDSNTLILRDNEGKTLTAKK